MTGNRNIPTPDEADLLAWVEGERLAPEMESAIRQMMAADPALKRKLEGMRNDRVTLVSIADEPAPSNLLAAVESALQPVLERELLLGLRDGEPDESRPVVSTVRPERRGIFQTFLADRAGRRMAMAAALLLLIGGATYWSTMMLTGAPQKPLTVARNEPPSIPGAPDDKALPVAANHNESRDSQSGTTRIATAPDRPAVPESSGSTGNPTSNETTIAAASPPEPSSGELVGPVKVPVDAALAAELARDHRLVIRVIPSQSGRTVAEKLKKDAKGTGWRLATEVPTELAAMLEPAPGETSPGAPVSREPIHIADSDPVPEALIGPPPPVDYASAGPVQSVYLVQARLDAATFAHIRSTLQKVGAADDVVFEERYDSLPIDGSAPILIPGAVVWWDSQPSSWTNWGEVPVVIEPR